jgi:hypothetical protein
MECVKGIVTKVTTTKDQCINVTVSVDKQFAEGINLLSWQDGTVYLTPEEEAERARGGAL